MENIEQVQAKLYGLLDTMFNDLDQYGYNSVLVKNINSIAKTLLDFNRELVFSEELKELQEKVRVINELYEVD